MLLAMELRDCILPQRKILTEFCLTLVSGHGRCHIVPETREEEHIDTPVLMLTARDTLHDKLQGFNCGADDYLVKPFALKEVEARLVAMHKRHGGKVTDRLLEMGDLSFDPKTLSTRFGGTSVKLSPKCIRLLAIMMNEPGKVFSQD